MHLLAAERGTSHFYVAAVRLIHFGQAEGRNCVSVFYWTDDD